MTPALPRVTYSNIAADFTPLHDWLDQAMRAFRLDVLGRAWPRLVEADRKTVRAAIEAARAAFPDWSEMGGKNPAYVTARADVDAAAEGVARSAWHGGGKMLGLFARLCRPADRVGVSRSSKEQDSGNEDWDAGRQGGIHWPGDR